MFGQLAYSLVVCINIEDHLSLALSITLFFQCLKKEKGFLNLNLLFKVKVKISDLRPAFLVSLICFTLLCFALLCFVLNLGPDFIVISSLKTKF